MQVFISLYFGTFEWIDFLLFSNQDDPNQEEVEGKKVGILLSWCRKYDLNLYTSLRIARNKNMKEINGKAILNS